MQKYKKEDVLNLFNLPFLDLIYTAQRIHKENFPENDVQISTLLSIKTGACPEDCKYCSQSAHYNTGLKKEPLMDVDAILEKAILAKNAGSQRFCMGAAWRSLHNKDVPKIVEIIKQVKEKTGLETCMTLGMITKDQALELKEAGLDYYNHNLDTSEEYYKDIITTRSYQDRIDTLDNVASVGLKTCCGGILGMGESEEDRASMLSTIANLEPQPESVPINMLIKIKGTPLGDDHKSIDPIDFVKTIAVARILCPKSRVRLSAGRSNMSDEMQALCFVAGANSIFYGDKLLTTPNPSENEDLELLEKLGINVKNVQEEELASS